MKRFFSQLKLIDFMTYAHSIFEVSRGFHIDSVLSLEKDGRQEKIGDLSNRLFLLFLYVLVS